MKLSSVQQQCPNNSWDKIHSYPGHLFAMLDVSLDQCRGIQPLGLPEKQQRCQWQAIGCMMTSLSYQGSIPLLTLQAQVRGAGKVLTFPHLTKVYSFQGHPNTTTTADKQCKEGHDEKPVDYLEEGFIFQAVKTLETTFILLLKIYDTYGQTLEDTDALSHSGCTV